MSYDVCLTDKKVKTRKEHKCFGCGKKFPAGRLLNYSTGIFEGSFYSNYLCNACDKEAHSSRDYFEYGFCGGDLREGRVEKVRNRK